MEHAQRTLAHGGGGEQRSAGAGGSERYANKAQAVKGVGGLLENIARINQRGFEEESELERQYETQVRRPFGCAMHAADPPTRLQLRRASSLRPGALASAHVGRDGFADLAQLDRHREHSKRSLAELKARHDREIEDLHNRALAQIDQSSRAPAKAHSDAMDLVSELMQQHVHERFDLVSALNAQEKALVEQLARHREGTLDNSVRAISQRLGGRIERPEWHPDADDGIVDDPEENEWAGAGSGTSGQWAGTRRPPSARPLSSAPARRPQSVDPNAARDSDARASAVRGRPGTVDPSRMRAMHTHVSRSRTPTRQSTDRSVRFSASPTGASVTRSRPLSSAAALETRSRADAVPTHVRPNSVASSRPGEHSGVQRMGGQRGENPLRHAFARNAARPCSSARADAACTRLHGLADGCALKVRFALAGPYIPSPHIRRDQLPPHLSPTLGASWLDSGQPAPGLPCPPLSQAQTVATTIARTPTTAQSGWEPHAHDGAEAGSFAPSAWVRPSGPVTSMSETIAIGSGSFFTELDLGACGQPGEYRADAVAAGGGRANARSGSGATASTAEPDSWMSGLPSVENHAERVLSEYERNGTLLYQSRRVNSSSDGAGRALPPELAQMDKHGGFFRMDYADPPDTTVPGKAVVHAGMREPFPQPRAEHWGSDVIRFVTPDEVGAHAETGPPPRQAKPNAWANWDKHFNSNSSLAAAPSSRPAEYPHAPIDLFKQPTYDEFAAQLGAAVSADSKSAKAALRREAFGVPTKDTWISPYYSEYVGERAAKPRPKPKATKPRKTAARGAPSAVVRSSGLVHLTHDRPASAGAAAHRVTVAHELVDEGGAGRLGLPPDAYVPVRGKLRPGQLRTEVRSMSARDRPKFHDQSAVPHRRPAPASSLPPSRPHGRARVRSGRPPAGVRWAVSARAGS
jgi:hypothetical protein